MLLPPLPSFSNFRFHSPPRAAQSQCSLCFPDSPRLTTLHPTLKIELNVKSLRQWQITLISPVALTVSKPQWPASNTHNILAKHSTLHCNKFQLQFTKLLLSPHYGSTSRLQVHPKEKVILIVIGHSLSHRSISCRTWCMCSALILVVESQKCKKSTGRLYYVSILTSLTQYKIEINKQSRSSPTSAAGGLQWLAMAISHPAVQGAARQAVWETRHCRMQRPGGLKLKWNIDSPKDNLSFQNTEEKLYGGEGRGERKPT